MDLTSLLPWLKFAHILGGFIFVGGHGVSMSMAFRLRHEREPARMLALLDLSAGGLSMALIGLLVLLVAGIADGLIAGYFSQAWIWLALVLLIAVGGVMTPLATGYFNGIRGALGQRTRLLKPGDPDPTPRPMEEVVALLASPRPRQVAAIGIVGLVVILWLMTFKPF